MPVFVTMNEYWKVEPAVFPLGVPATLSRVSDGAEVIGVSVESVPVTGGPVGGFAPTPALLATWPLSTSACVSVYVAVHVVVAFGASVATGQLTVPTVASVTETEVSVTLPVFVTTKLYAMVAPAALPDGVPACLSTVTEGVRVIGVVTELVAVTAVAGGRRARWRSRCWSRCPRPRPPG